MCTINGDDPYRKNQPQRGCHPVKKFWKIVLWITVPAVLLAAGAGIFAWYCNYTVKRCSEYCYDDTNKLPQSETALLLGAAKITPNGVPNLYFAGRIEAAAKLFHAGKIKHILISGDNSRKDYDEPTDMKNALIERGVPGSAMTLDYAGFRTLDSIVRCKEIFSCDKITVISQRFHAERALYIADKYGIDAIAFAAADTPWKWLNERNWKREKYARTAAWLDLNILFRSPRYLGEKISLPSVTQTGGKVAQ